MSAFALNHAEAREALADWVAIVKAARWTSADHLRRTMVGARPISDKRAVFNVQGNKYRIICDIQYADDRYHGIVRVQFIGTHAEYNEVDALTVTHTAFDR